MTIHDSTCVDQADVVAGQHTAPVENGRTRQPADDAVRSSFIKQFHCPEPESGGVCFPFWELVAAAGCPFRCSYCFLQGTLSYVFGHYPLQGALFKNWPDMVREVERWLEHLTPRMMVLGELQDGYAATIEKINELGPEMVTLGALRASSNLPRHAKAFGRDTSVFDLLTTRDPGGFKRRLPDDLHIDMLKFAVDRLDVPKVALCKEHRSVWDAVGLEFRGCHCLLGADDALCIQGG